MGISGSLGLGLVRAGRAVLPPVGDPWSGWRGLGTFDSWSGLDGWWLMVDYSGPWLGVASRSKWFIAGRETRAPFRGLFLGEGLVVGLFLVGLDGGESSGHEDFAAFFGEDGRRVEWRELGFGLGQTGGVQEALEFGGEAEAGEFVGHPDIGIAVRGVFDAGAEIAGGVDLSGGSANDAGEEIVDFLEA